MATTAATIENIDVDFEISKAHMKSNEWNIEKYFGFNPFETHAFYLMDYRQKEVAPQLITVAKESVNDIVINHGPEVYASGVAHFSHVEQTEEATNKLAQSLCHYIKGTQCYKLWRKQVAYGARFSAVINMYGIKGASPSDALLRPMMVDTGGVLLTPGDVSGLCDRILIADRANPNYADCKI